MKELDETYIQISVWLKSRKDMKLKDWRFPGVKKIMMPTATSPQVSITEDIFSIFLGGTQVIQGLIKRSCHRVSCNRFSYLSW